MKRLLFALLSIFLIKAAWAQDPTRSEDASFLVHKSYKEFRKAYIVSDAADSTLFIYQDSKRNRIAIKQRNVWYSIPVPVNTDSIYLSQLDIDRDKLPELIVRYKIFKEDSLYTEVTGGMYIYTFKDRARQILDLKNFCAEYYKNPSDSSKNKEYERKVLMEPGFILIYQDESGKYKFNNCTISKLKAGIYNLFSEKFFFYKIVSE
jgi:hypothetical protein